MSLNNFGLTLAQLWPNFGLTLVHFWSIFGPTLADFLDKQNLPVQIFRYTCLVRLVLRPTTIENDSSDKKKNDRANKYAGIGSLTAKK